MMNEMDLEAIIDDYLKGNLNDAEAQAFEELRRNNPDVDRRTLTQKAFLDAFTAYGHTASLKDKMDVIHSELDIEGLVERYSPKPNRIVAFWRSNKAAIAMAASFILLSAVGLNFYKFSEQESDYAQMRGKIRELASSQETLIRDIRSTQRPKHIDPGKFGGSGFALSTNGYICTNYHVVANADSIYVQNNDGASFKAQVAFYDKENDLAVLKIVDNAFTRLPSLPYAIKTSKLDIGETVYTLGFPKDDPVLGEGYVSSRSGFGGDTVMYQVDLPVNPGNSGGPVLDNNGNIIGVVSSKSMKSDGAAFAIKSKYILDALRAIPSDSLYNKISKIKHSQLAGLKRQNQVKKIQDHVFMIRVY